MAVYVVQGKLGTGKTKYAVSKLQEALRQGRRVATNLDLFMEHLVGPMNKSIVMRLPDKPSADDLMALGHGNPDSYDEERNGVLVLDELGSWLNSRQFQDKSRQALIDWLIHARKYGWDCYLIVQNVNMLDKQVREALAEYLIKTIRADKIRIPIVGTVLGKKGRLPRFHIARIYIADMPNVVVDREFFRGDDLHKAYDTRQIFKDGGCGLYSYLSAWHLKGRYMQSQQKKSWLQRLFTPKPLPKLQPKPKTELVAKLESLPVGERLTVWHWMNQRGLT